MTQPRTGGCNRFSMAAAAGLLLFLTVLTGCGGTSPAQAPPPPSSSPTAPAPPIDAAPIPATAVPAVPPSTAPTKPKAFRVASIEARSELQHVGLRNDGTLEVPPGSPGAPAAWFTGSPAPGEPGPAVILGHVNAEGGGPGIFADLRKLQPGDEVEIIREDGSTAVFSVQHGEQYPKDAFPSEKVYGNTEGPELRLITCDGYDPKAGTFADNYVVYARLVR